jgi:DNA-binding beta-propeller fold protein YncE
LTAVARWRRRSIPILALCAACGPDGANHGRLYVTSGFTDQVFVLSAEDGSLLDTLRLDPRREEADEPHGIAVSADGAHWYATVSHGEPTLWKFESAGNRLVGRLRLDQAGASRIGITPDDSLGFVPDYNRGGQGTPGELAVVRLHDLHVLVRLKLCPAPHHASPSPDGSRVAVTCALSDELVFLDVSSLRPLARVGVADSIGSPGRPLHRPMNVAWEPKGTRIFVSLMGSDEVGVFTADGARVGGIPTGKSPAQLATTRDGRTLVVANRGGTVSIIDTRTSSETHRVDLSPDERPHGVALHPNGQTAFVAMEGSVERAGAVVAVDLHTGDVLWRRPTGVYVLGIAWGPDAGPGTVQR